MLIKREGDVYTCEKKGVKYANTFANKSIVITIILLKKIKQIIIWYYWTTTGGYSVSMTTNDITIWIKHLKSPFSNEYY